MFLCGEKHWQWGWNVISPEANRSRISQWCLAVWALASTTHCCSHSSLLIHIWPSSPSFTLKHWQFVLVCFFVRESFHPIVFTFSQIGLSQKEWQGNRETERDSQGQTTSGCWQFKSGLKRPFAMHSWKSSSLWPGLWCLESSRVEGNMLLMHSHPSSEQSWGPGIQHKHTLLPRAEERD